MKKNILKLLLVVTLSSLLLVGCGNDSSDEAEDKVIKVGATPSPHAEILNYIATEVEEQGYTLEIVEFQDYVLPNTTVDEGELDANYFQHLPYLEDFNNNKNTKLASVGAIHYELLGIYVGVKTDIKGLEKGDKVGVPNDTTNEARALQLLQAEGVITLKDGVGLEATKIDIVENPYEIEIIELEAAIIPRSLPDLALAVINGNYAIDAGLTTGDAIAFESVDSEVAEEFANILVVKKGNENEEFAQVLYSALTSESARDFMEEEYKGAVLPAF